MALNNTKRTIYQAQIKNSITVKPDQTIVPVLLRKVIEDKTKSGKNPGAPYWKLRVTCMNLEPIFVRTRDNGKRAKTDEDPGPDDEGGEDGSGEPVKRGTTLEPGADILVTSYDKTVSTLDDGILVRLAMTSDRWEDRWTFQAGSVIVDAAQSNILCDKVYNNVIAHTDLSKIPTLDNLRREDFPHATDDKYVMRNFVLPLSENNSAFANVEIQLSESDTARFWAKDRESEEQLIGVNTPSTNGVNNSFKVVFTSREPDEPKVMMTLAYNPTVWRCFGVTSLDHWQKTAARFLFHAQGWYVYGFSSLKNLDSIAANKTAGSYGGDYDDDSESFMHSTGFVTKMGLDLKATVRRIGIPLSMDYMDANFGPDSGYEQDVEVRDHPINASWKVAVRRNVPFLVNFTDLTSEQVASFLKEVKRGNSSVEFFGVFPVGDDSVYEFPAEKAEEREAFVVERRLTPVLVFAVNK